MTEYALTVFPTNIHREPDAKSDLIAQIDTNSTVAVIEHGCMWCKIVKDCYEGFCKTENLKFENGSTIDEEEDTVTISIPRDCACALYEALKFSLKNNKE